MLTLPPKINCPFITVLDPQNSEQHKYCFLLNVSFVLFDLDDHGEYNRGLEKRQRSGVHLATVEVRTLRSVCRETIGRWHHLNPLLGVFGLSLSHSLKLGDLVGVFPVSFARPVSTPFLRGQVLANSKRSKNEAKERGPVVLITL